MSVITTVTTMKVSEAFEEAKAQGREKWLDIDELANALNLFITFSDREAYDKFEEKVKSYWINTWVCTDTSVGLAAHFFEDKPLALSWQACRKCGIYFDFVSKEVVDEVRGFLLTLSLTEFPILDKDKEIPAEYLEKRD